jgi:hypothetical protein
MNAFRYRMHAAACGLAVVALAGCGGGDFTDELINEVLNQVTAPAGDGAAPRPDDPTSAPAPATGRGGGATLDAATLQQITQFLGDKLLTLGSSFGNSDNNAFVTSSDELFLCAVGQALFRETTIFSSSVGSSESVDETFGTWRVISRGGAPFIELTVQQTSRNDVGATLLFEILADANGNIVIDNRFTEVSDATNACR